MMVLPPDPAAPPPAPRNILPPSPAASLDFQSVLTARVAGGLSTLKLPKQAQDEHDAAQQTHEAAPDTRPTFDAGLGVQEDLTALAEQQMRQPTETETPRSPQEIQSKSRTASRETPNPHALQPSFEPAETSSAKPASVQAAVVSPSYPSTSQGNPPNPPLPADANAQRAAKAITIPSSNRITLIADSVPGRGGVQDRNPATSRTFQPGTGVQSSSTRAAQAPPVPPQTSTAAAPTPREVVTPQVVRGLALALQQGGGRVTLRLNPEHLGQVVVHVKVDNGTVNAGIETTDKAAHRLLQDSTESLRAALEARGLSVERIDVYPPPDGQESPGAPAQDQGHSNSRQSADPENQNSGQRPRQNREGADASPAWIVPDTRTLGPHREGLGAFLEAVA